MQPAPDLPAPGRTALRRGVLCAAVVAALAVPPVANATGLTGQRQPAAAPPHPVAAPCAPKQLPTLGGGQGTALAVSSNGLVRVSPRTGPAHRSRCCGRRCGQRISTGLVNVSPTGVNSRGEVVGIGVEPSPWTRSAGSGGPGTDHVLRTPAGTVALPAAISDTGRIVGALASDDDGAANPTSGEAPEQAASWPSLARRPRSCPPCPATSARTPTASTSKGVAVGNSQAQRPLHPRRVGHRGQGDGAAGAGRQRGASPARSTTPASRSGTRWRPAVIPRRSRGTSGATRSSHGKANGRHTQGTGLVHGRAVGTTEVRGGDGVDRPQAVLFDATRDRARCHRCPVTQGRG